MTTTIRASGLSPHGYVYVRRPNGARTYMHIFLAELALGRQLTDGEVVHHIDGDKTNNANANLLICTAAYHALLHSRLEASSDWPQFKRRTNHPNGQRPVRSSLGYKGVEQCGTRFVASCSIENKKRYIGAFATAKDAARAYDNYVLANRGPNWITNKVLGLI